MKQFTFLLLSVLMASAAYGQKPKLGKAEVLLKNGSLAEARDIVDMAVDYEKTKDNPKTYYLRGLVYAALDTTGSDLVDNPFEIAIASFAKSDELNDSDKELFLIGSNGFPVTKGQHIQEYYSYYFEKAAASFGDERYDDATNEFVLAQQIMPNDTVAFVYAGYAANSAENYPVAKANFEKAIEMGAADKDMYNLLVYIIGTKEEDKEGALKMINRARKIYPSDSDLARNEIALLIQMERVEEAQASLMSQIENEPDDPNLYFTLGILYQELADNSEGANVKATHNAKALAAYKQAIDVDPNFYNAHYNIGVLMINEANDVIKESNNLGVSKADMKKAQQLAPVIQEKLKAALPQWEKLHQLKATDVPTLETLQYLYTKLKMYDKAEEVMDKIDALNQ